MDDSWIETSTMNISDNLNRQEICQDNLQKNKCKINDFRTFGVNPDTSVIRFFQKRGLVGKGCPKGAPVAN